VPVKPAPVKVIVPSEPATIASENVAAELLVVPAVPPSETVTEPADLVASKVTVYV
jgi:hypothetical protein